MSSITIEQIESIIGKQSEAINQRFDAIDSKFNDIDNKFSDIDNKFSDIKSKLSSIDTRFDELGRQVAIGFEDLESRLDVRERVSRLEEDFGALKQALHI